MALLLQRHKMPEQDPKIRVKNFDEVELGYDEETAVAEAMRCLNCKIPQCVKGCPIKNHIPEFIQKMQERDFAAAFVELKKTNSLPAVCGRVCPQENQCEKYCILGKKGESVAIGSLERFVGDYGREQQGVVEKITLPQGAKKVAIVGSGPAGLSAASDLAELGYRVTVFEALHQAGGILSYGIPEFRLPKEKIVQPEIEQIAALGVEFVLNVKVGEFFTVDELMDKEGFSAVFLAGGTGSSMAMQIPGEELNGVYAANDFLRSCNLMMTQNISEQAAVEFVGKKVAVVGGGNVAMDAARTALRAGASEVYLL